MQAVLSNMTTELATGMFDFTKGLTVDIGEIPSDITYHVMSIIITDFYGAEHSGVEFDRPTEITFSLLGQNARFWANLLTCHLKIVQYWVSEVLCC